MPAILLNHRILEQQPLESQPVREPQVVVLLHGLFGSLTNLASLGRALSENYRVILADLRNHGDSPHSDDMSYPLMAQDIEQLLNSLNIQRAHFVGHSMGGKVAMQVALNHANRVNKLVVADIAPVTYRATTNLGALEGLCALQHADIHTRKDADNLLAAHISEPGIRAFLLKNLIRNDKGQFQLKLNMSSIAANYAKTLNLAPEPSPQGQPFIGPTLFIKGSDSAYIQEKHRETINRLFPNAQLKIIQGTGHWLHAEKPEIFNRLVQQFLL
ncbi:MAG: alpha/beta fold hydrolase [Porticoccaceae bacterium]|nr:alpha/beta fold hydrolase [Pseudomonadales bacterium]MCP5173261.1 alpha/beta fold hydrolase [Pseudomonadales bacterium]